MPEVEITGLKRVSRPKPNKGGSIILAYFDCEVIGFALRGCALVRTSRNGLVAWPPNLQNADGMRSIAIRDDSIRHAIMEAARTAYRALGGIDAEWMPHDPTDDGRRTANREAYARRIQLKHGHDETAVEEDGGLRRFLSNGAE